MSPRSAVRIQVRQPFTAEPDRVFHAWLKPKMLEQWMFGPAVREEEIVHLSVDPRAGGAFSFLVERPEGLVEHVGKYLEIAPARRLVFTWMAAGDQVGSRVTVEIEPQARGCELTLTQDLHPSWAEHADAIAASWAHMLDCLARLMGPLDPRASGRA